MEQELEGELINWNGNKFEFKFSAYVEELGVKTWANGDFQSYCKNSRAFIVNGAEDQMVIVKIKGIWHRGKIIQILSPVDFVVESKETLERAQCTVSEVKVLSLELSKIKLSTIKCQMNKIVIQEERRELFKSWRSRILGC